MAESSEPEMELAKSSEEPEKEVAKSSEEPEKELAKKLRKRAIGFAAMGYVSLVFIVILFFFAIFVYSKANDISASIVLKDSIAKLNRIIDFERKINSQNIQGLRKKNVDDSSSSLKKINSITADEVSKLNVKDANINDLIRDIRATNDTLRQTRNIFFRAIEDLRSEQTQVYKVADSLRLGYSRGGIRPSSLIDLYTILNVSSQNSFNTVNNLYRSPYIRR